MHCLVLPERLLMDITADDLTLTLKCDNVSAVWFRTLGKLLNVLIKYDGEMGKERENVAKLSNGGYINVNLCFQGHVSPEWWVWRCHGTASLETQSTLPPVWNPLGCVSFPLPLPVAPCRCSSNLFFSLICLVAYRIHVNMSTVKILHSLNEGYKIQVRGKTELKVNLPPLPSPLLED